MNTKEIISKLTDSQKERFLREAIDFAVMNDKSKKTRPDSCPCCGRKASKKVLYCIWTEQIPMIGWRISVFVV